MVLSLVVALALDMLPAAAWVAYPDFVALVLAFWAIREPRRVGMGAGFVLGVVMDVADGSLMGQHVLVYVLLTFFAAFLARRILWFPLVQQALQLFPLFMGSLLLQFGVRLFAGADFPGWWHLISPFVTTVLWIPATYLLLLPQYQPLERDDNRPL